MKMWDTLLIVGAHDSERPLLREIFNEDYNLLEAESINQGIVLMEQNKECLVCVILCRPPLEDDGSSFLMEAKKRGLSGEIPIIAIITPTGTGHFEELAFSLGAFDVVSRPVIRSVIRRRVHVMVDLYRKQQEMSLALHDQAESIRHTNEVMVDALSSIIEYRSAESSGHIMRIRRFSEILLNEVARSCHEYGLTDDMIRMISSASSLHDIGKISVPDRILNKPDDLNDEEQAIMRTHTKNGARIIESLSGISSEEYLRYAYNICLYHHERFDGSGYPEGLAGDDIPICAQVVGLADAFDALANDRVYKAAIRPGTAINMILEGECGVFSPKLLACFSHCANDFIELTNEYVGGRNPKNDTITLPLPAPNYSKSGSGSLHTAQQKYQALLHYLRATVIETDLDSGAFHTIYNPLPNFKPLSSSFLFDDEPTLDSISSIHPEDAERTLKEYHFLKEGFFEEGLRKHSFTTRIWSATISEYRTHEVTWLRLDPNGTNGRKALLIWRPVSEVPSPSAMSDEMGKRIIQENKALLIMGSNMICRKNDKWYTISHGAGNLLDLIGYTEKEIETLFENKFTELIFEDDRDAFRAKVTEKAKSGTVVESEYRVRHKNGRMLWILERGCIVTDDMGKEYFYGTLWDHTSSHAAQSELEEALWCNQFIIDKTENVMVDWRMEEEQIKFSPNWEKVFGYKPNTELIPTDKILNAAVHPDDMPVINELLLHIRRGEQIEDTELRVIGKDRQYIWCRLRVSVLKDPSGIPHRIIGVLTNINKEKCAYTSLQNQSIRDSLTGLLNKAATHNAIKDHLAEHGENGCALLMIDLDNFKGVNDKYGHLFGDTVLTRVASIIRKMFRSEDIIGRVGGDEFMVMMKGRHDEHLVNARCDMLFSELSGIFNDEFPECVISCSIGAAFAPEHGTTFQNLFRHADQALYYSKKQGKHCCTIYHEGMQLGVQSESTPIDNASANSIAEDGLVRRILRQLANSKDLERTINDIVTMVGKTTNASRVYIFENNDENTHCSNTFEWCNTGITPEIHNLQNICYATDLPGWEDNYDENDILFCPEISQLAPGAREILEPQGIKSMIHCAIRENGVFRGYIGLDECRINRIWTQEEVDILTFLAEIVASFLLRKRIQDKADAANKNLQSILETQRVSTYVINSETYKFEFVNSRTKRAFPHIKVGDICYRSFAGLDRPCDDCPMDRLDEHGHASGSPFDKRQKHPVTTDATKIVWNESPACLFNCYVKKSN